MRKDVFKVDTQGLAQLEALLKELPQEIASKVVVNSFRKGAIVIRKRAKELAPASTREEADAGGKKKLKQSISILRPRGSRGKKTSDIALIVRAKHRLAWLAEYGSQARKRKSDGSTGVMPAFAYMRKTVDEKGRAAVEAIAVEAKKLLELGVMRLAEKYKTRRKK